MSEVGIESEEIPDELKDRDQWLLWDSSADSPRRPHWRGDFSVSWTDPDDWHTFEEAIEAAGETDSWGIGYVFANENGDHPRGLYGALDLDGCVDEDGHPKEWLPSLQPFFEQDAYMEYSPSGTGIHIPIVGFEAPDWWSNVHLTEDEHEGVEAYGKKFFTFTGDRLRQSGDDVVEDGEFVENWLIEAYKSITGEDPTEKSSNEFESASEGGRANRDDFLEETDIREALDHVNPDVSYDVWRDIGFALADFFTSEHTALSVFTDWSRGGSKWDDEAEDLAERIIKDSKDGGGRTIGTVIHHARQGGWKMPKSKPKKRKESSEGGRTVFTTSWDDVIEQYIEEGQWTGRYYAAEALDDRYDWMYVLESEKLWVYDEEKGYYHPWGEELVANRLERHLGQLYAKTDLNEVIAKLQARHQTHREELNARSRDGYYLCVGNGVVNLETGELHDHDPLYHFTRGLPWDYDPATADPEPVLDFLDDITNREEDRDTLLDHLAHGLMPGHPYRAFVMIYGPGSNGKTQFGALLRGFVGEDNAASVELQDLTGEDKFATGGLPGAFVNVGDDVSVSEIRDVSILKSLTGGGTVRANEKFEKQYEFKNEAAMFFSANEPPRISEESEAIGDRLYPIKMPYRFLGEGEYEPDNPDHKKKEPGIADSLIDDEEAMKGLLLLAVKHAQELIESNGQYSQPEGPKKRREIYEAASDPIRRFALDYLEQGNENDLILKDDGFDVYREMCRIENERAASADGFKRQISQQAIIDLESARSRNITPGDSRDRCWRYVRFNEEAKEFMSPRLVERYFPGDDQAALGDEEEDDDSLQQDRAAFGADPIMEAAKSPTGYVTVTAEIASVEWLGEDKNGLKAILTDSTGAMDLKVWADDYPEWCNRLEDLEGAPIVAQSVEVYHDDYDDTRKLRPVEGLSSLNEVQHGVGYIGSADPGIQGQEQLEDVEGSAAVDGGTPDAGAELEQSQVPDDAEGKLADAQRLVQLVQNAGKPMEEPDLVAKATQAYDLDADRVQDVLEFAVHEKGLLIKEGNEYVVG